MQINRQGNEPTKIHVKRGDKEWDVTEKTLGELPAEIRSHVEKMMGHMHWANAPGMSRAIRVSPEGKVEGVLNIKPVPPAAPVAPAAPAPPVPPAPPVKAAPATRAFTARMERSDDGTAAKLDAIMKKLEKLETEVESSATRSKRGIGEGGDIFASCDTGLVPVGHSLAATTPPPPKFTRGASEPLQDLLATSGLRGNNVHERHVGHFRRVGQASLLALAHHLRRRQRHFYARNSPQRTNNPPQSAHHRRPRGQCGAGPTNSAGHCGGERTIKGPFLPHHEHDPRPKAQRARPGRSGGPKPATTRSNHG